MNSLDIYQFFSTLGTINYMHREENGKLENIPVYTLPKAMIDKGARG
jgi:hypothetical protein